MLRKGLALVLALGLVSSAFAGKSDKEEKSGHPRKIERFCENVQKAEFPSGSTYLKDSIEKLGKLLKDGESLTTSLTESSKDRLCNQIKELHDMVKSDSKRMSSFNSTLKDLRKGLKSFLPKTTTETAKTEAAESEEVEMPEI